MLMCVVIDMLMLVGFCLLIQLIGFWVNLDQSSCVCYEVFVFLFGFENLVKL